MPYDVNDYDYGIFVPSDTAKYTGRKLPCQALPLIIAARGVSLCVKTPSGSFLPTSKQGVRDAMENGKYVWVSSRSPRRMNVTEPFCFEVDMCDEIKDYAPIYQDILRVETDLNSAVLSAGHRFSLQGRARKFHGDGRVGRAFNLAKGLAFIQQAREARLQRDFSPSPLHEVY